MNIADWIDKHAQFSPQKVAIRFEGRKITYGGLAVGIGKTAVFLRQLDITHGDRVAVLGFNSPEYIMLLFACARIGAIFNPLNFRLAVPEHLYILQHAEAKLLILEAAFAHLVAPVRAELPHCQLVGLDFVPEGGVGWAELGNMGAALPSSGNFQDPLMLVYTSGTTGRPKGAVLTQEALLWNAINSQHMQNLTSEDHVLTVLPLFHVGGMNNQTTPALHFGATVTLHRRFHPDETLRAIGAERPSLTCLVPATMQACIDSPLWPTTDFSSLRLNVTGSTTVPAHLSDQFRARGVAVVEMYGATETGPIAVYQRPDSDFSKVGSTGLPGLHCQIRIVDDLGGDVAAGEAGEILVKGPNIMQGYWRNPTATAATIVDGWLHTGDIGYRDEAGYLYIKDRKKHVIISGGENIYPAEVERVLLTHEGVRETAVIGLPDEKWGEVPLAVVVAETAVSLTAADLERFLEGKLARYKIPRHYRFVSELPKNAMGKILHYKVREQQVGGAG